MGESMKKEATRGMDNPSKLFFEFLKNHDGNICLNFEVSFYTFKFVTTKYSWKFTMFQESFYMFKALKRSMWTYMWFIFCFKKFFFLIKCSQNRFNFFVNFNIFHMKRSRCSKHSKNKNTYTHLYFDPRTSLSIITVLNL